MKSNYCHLFSRSSSSDFSEFLSQKISEILMRVILHLQFYEFNQIRVVEICRTFAKQFGQQALRVFVLQMAIASPWKAFKVYRYRRPPSHLSREAGLPRVRRRGRHRADRVLQLPTLPLRLAALRNCQLANVDENWEGSSLAVSMPILLPVPTRIGRGSLKALAILY